MTDRMMVFLLGSILFTAIPGEQSQPQEAPASPDIPAFVHQLDSLRKAADIPGLSVAVVKDQALVLAVGLGYADPERQIPATAETPYDIASVSKPLSAVVALGLVEEGVLDLDRPMASYSEWRQFCTEFSQGDGAAGGVVSTVLDLAKFDIALDQRTLISAESRAVMMTPARSTTGEVLPYGVGWFVQEYLGTLSCGTPDGCPTLTPHSI